MNCKIILVIPKIPEGYIAWLHMASQNLWVVFWPDLFHKINRKTQLALATPHNGTAFMRRLNRLFRVLRGPWGTSRFGSSIQDARKQLISLLERGEGQDLIEMYMCGCARDRGKTEFEPGEVLAALREKAGQVKFYQVKESKKLTFLTSKGVVFELSNPNTESLGRSELMTD